MGAAHLVFRRIRYTVVFILFSRLLRRVIAILYLAPPCSHCKQITMCTYANDGTGKCRDCSERVTVDEDTRQVRTTKHYTCSGPETRTSWSENSGMIPAGQRPDRYTTSQRIIATCIFRPEARTFECHGGSNDGSCGLTSAGYGATGSSSYSGDVGSSSLSRCLTGEKWTGTYRGSIY